MIIRLAQQMWIERIWPIQTGIYFSDDTVIPLEILMPWETNNKQVSIQAMGSAKLSELSEFHESWRSSLLQTCEQVYPELNLRITGGEGSHGSDGFVTVTHINDEHMVWLAFFDCSNPFESVSLVNNSVVAISNLGHVWRFPLKRPENVVCKAG